MRSSILMSMKPAVIVEMLEMAFSLENWDMMIDTSDILYSCSQYIYEERQHHKAKGLPVPTLDTAYPLVYYYGFSHLMRGIAYQKQGYYDQARECIYKYAELSWVEDSCEQGIRIVKDFQFLAKINLYTLEILAGKTEQLLEYVDFLQDNLEKLFPGLDTILQAVLLHNLNVDELINTFATNAMASGECQADASISYYYNFCYYLALYHKRAGRQSDALECILQCIILAHRSSNNKNFKRCMELFESLQEWATGEQVRQYHAVLTASLE